MSDAKNSRAQARSGFGIWLDQHLYSFVSSLGRTVRRPWATLLTIGVMAVAFVLPLGLWLALQGPWRTGGSLLFAALWLLAELCRGVLFTGFPWGALG